MNRYRYFSKTIDEDEFIYDMQEDFTIDNLGYSCVLLNSQNKEFEAYKRALDELAIIAWGNKVSFVSSNCPNRITNSKEYAEYFINKAREEIEKELKDE